MLAPYSLETLYRVRAAPVAHIGRPSLLRLEAFHRGYTMFCGQKDRELYNLSPDLRTRLMGRYGISSSLGPGTILRKVAESDEKAFDLFFHELDVALSDPDAVSRDEHSPFDDNPMPQSAYLDALGGDHTLMWFLPVRSVACLRAFLDGYGLAAAENGNFECLDLDGFEHWLRRRFEFKGLFRWEERLSDPHGGMTDEVLFDQAISELRAFRMSKGPLSERQFKIVRRDTDANDEDSLN